MYLQRVASEHGMILVDTKYEFGKAPDGSVLLIDEVLLSLLHTYLHTQLVTISSQDDLYKLMIEIVTTYAGPYS